MAILSEQLQTSRTSGLPNFFIFRASCDLCGCASLAWTLGQYRYDAYGQHEAHYQAGRQGWIQRLGGPRGNVLQSLCPPCQADEAAESAA